VSLSDFPVHIDRRFNHRMYYTQILMNEWEESTRLQVQILDMQVNVAKICTLGFVRRYLIRPNLCLPASAPDLATAAGGHGGGGHGGGHGWFVNIFVFCRPMHCNISWNCLEMNTLAWCRHGGHGHGHGGYTKVNNNGLGLLGLLGLLSLLQVRSK